MNAYSIHSSLSNGLRTGTVLIRFLVAAVISTFGTMTASAATPSVSKADASFLKSAYQGGLYEIEVGKYAAANGASDDVRALGQQMVTDHTALNEKVASLAEKKGVTLDTEPTTVTSAKIKTATVLSGKAFDKTYVPLAIHDHKSDIKAFKKEEAATSDSDVRSAVKDALPTLKHHLMMAKETKARLS